MTPLSEYQYSIPAQVAFLWFCISPEPAAARPGCEDGLDSIHAAKSEPDSAQGNAVHGRVVDAIGLEAAYRIMFKRERGEEVIACPGNADLGGAAGSLMWLAGRI